MPRFEAALLGVRQVGFTVLSMSLSLIAVFIPILLMGGQVGRSFREFAVTLSVAILISMVISLTTTPMMCARLLTVRSPARSGAASTAGRRRLRGAARPLPRHAGLGAAPRPPDDHRPRLHGRAQHLALHHHPQGLLPEEDTGRMSGFIQADQSISFQRMSQKLRQYMRSSRPTRTSTTSSASPGRRARRQHRPCSSPRSRSASARVSSEQIIARLRPKLAHVPGAPLFMFPQQETPRTGGRVSNTAWQYTLQSDNLETCGPGRRS
jgi:multidrug efflux pump